MRRKANARAVQFFSQMLPKEAAPPQRRLGAERGIRLDAAYRLRQGLLSSARAASAQAPPRQPPTVQPGRIGMEVKLKNENAGERGGGGGKSGL